MNMNTTTKTFDVPALLTELQAAEQEFTAAVAIVEAAGTFLSNQKGRLNEHQFVQKLEAAGTDVARATRVVGEQQRLRVSYMSGRLAYFCAVNRLHTGLRSHDKLVRTIMKMVATIPHLQDVEQRSLLASACFETAQRSEAVITEVRARREKEQHKDLTEGRGVEALDQLYKKLLADGLSGMEQEVRQMTVVEMTMIPIAYADLREYRFAGRKVNDELVDAANSALSLLSGGGDFWSPWNQYFNSKGALNEPQYATRLQHMLLATPPNPAGVKVVKDQQRWTRIEFLRLRSAVSEMHRRLGEMAADIDVRVEALKQHIAEDTTCGANQKLVAMNNVIAAAAISTKIKRMIERWNAELAETESSRTTAEASLIEALGELVSQHPYAGLRWSCHGPQSYTEPL